MAMPEEAVDAAAGAEDSAAADERGASGWTAWDLLMCVKWRLDLGADLQKRDLTS
jgi:hypothetical protein